jgi:hypothetical protein
MNVFERLNQDFLARCTPLDERGEAADLVKVEMNDSNPDTVMRAQVEFLGTEITRVTAQGDLKKAAELRVEIAKVRAQLQEREGKRRWVWQEYAAIREERKEIATRVLDELFPDIRQACVDAATQYVELLDSTWRDLQRFEREAQCPLSRFIHHDTLRISNHGETRLLSHRFATWGLG